MTDCAYKETNGSCAHPGNRNCCSEELIHKSSPECEKNNEREVFFGVTKEKVKRGPSQKRFF